MYLFIRFELQYCSPGGNHALFTVDTRGQDDECDEDGSPHCRDEMACTPLEKLIHTK